MKNFKDLSIIIPVINERVNLEKLLGLLREMYPGVSIFVADDGSVDGTREFMMEAISGSEGNICYLERSVNGMFTNMPHLDEKLFYSDPPGIRNTAGLTASVVDSLQLVATEKFAVMHADFQHPPELAGKMYDALENAELAVAHRETLEGFAPHRKLISLTGNFIANSVLPLRSRVKDPLSGAFGGLTAHFRNILSEKENFSLEGFKVLFDILRKLPEGTRITDVGYDFKMRTSGESKIGMKQILSFFSSVFDRRTRKFLAGVALMLAVVLTGNILVIRFGDLNLSRNIRVIGLENPELRSFFRIITDYGHHIYHVLFLGILVTGIRMKRKDLVRLGITYILVQLIASIFICGGLKRLFGRPRPRTGEHIFNNFTNRSRFHSFPSGHTTDAFSSAGVIWAHTTSYWVSLLSFFFSGLIGFSRIILNAHFTLDVITGLVIGFGTGLVVTYSRFKKPETPR